MRALTGTRASDDIAEHHKVGTETKFLQSVFSRLRKCNPAPAPADPLAPKRGS